MASHTEHGCEYQPLRYGSLCTGIRGLDLAVERHFGATAAWHSEIEPAVAAWLAARWPEVPNLGDIKLIDWSDTPPVEILTAGYPCQPFSHAGKRKGTDDPRHLWPFILEGVRHLRPHHVVLENVRGHLSMGFDSVLGSLAEAGFDAEWCVIRASDVGAPHQRARVFIVATDPQQHEPRPERRHGPVTGVQHGVEGAAPPSGGDRPAPDTRGERHGGGQDGRTVGRVDSSDEGETRERQRSRTVPVDRDAAALADTGGQRLDGHEGVEGDGRHPSERCEASRHVGDGATSWGEYAPAIRRWECVIGRPAPTPTDGTQLALRFVEWMQGYDEGWVDGFTRTAGLKALGNAVVQQQALAALDELCPNAALIGAVA